MKIRHKTERLGHLIDLRAQILLDPSWQRGPVWTRPTKALLIDSILRRYDVPMVYLLERDVPLPHKFEVVDGQQRLRAIWEFIDGDYSLSKDAPNIDNVPISNKQYDQLPNAFRNRLRTFEIVVAYITGARQPQVSEVFARMQMGVRLNPPELRNAIQTGLRHAIDGIARDHPFFKNSKIPSLRFNHQDFLAHAVSVCHHGATRDAKAAQLKDDYIQLADSNIYSPLMAATDDILNVLDSVNLEVSKRMTQKWMFVDLFYFLYQNRKRLTSIKPHRLIELYRVLDNDRREFNAEPERLLESTPTDAEKDLYDYIMAFKYAGGEKSNLQQRAQVIVRRFAKPLGL